MTESAGLEYLVFLPLAVAGILFFMAIAYGVVFLCLHRQSLFRFFVHMFVGYRQLRNLHDSIPKISELENDVRRLLETAEETRTIRTFDGQPISYAEAERKSTLSLLCTYMLAVALNNTIRSPRPLTSCSRRLIFFLLRPQVGFWATDILDLTRRLWRRTVREITDIVLVGRLAGMGKLAAAEVPALEYHVPPDIVEFQPLFRLWDRLAVPKRKLEGRELDEAAKDAWLVLGQVAWFQGGETAAGSPTRSIRCQLGLPKLSENPAQREDLLRHFSPPEDKSVEFDTFLRDKVEEYRKAWGQQSGRGTATQADHITEKIAARQFAVDRYAIGMYEALAVAATELSRRPTVPRADVFELFNDALWTGYIQFLQEGKRYFDSEGDKADQMSLVYGKFMRIVMVASGRREVQGLVWAFKREFPRWQLEGQPETRRLSNEVGGLIEDYHLTEDAGEANPQDGALYQACLEPCRNYKCHANWDAGLLFAGNAQRKLDLVSRVIIIACHHMKGADRFDRVLGIAAGGIETAAAIALILRKPLSAVNPDNVLNLVPQAAVAERWLLVDDAYQTGYSYQLVRSQMVGLQPAPPPENLFALFKAKSRRDTLDVASFKLTEIMNETRKRVGCVLEYEYVAEAEGSRGNSTGSSYGHYPVPRRDLTKAVDPKAAAKMADIIRKRTRQSRERCSTNKQEELLDEVWNIIARNEFVKVELLYDYPDLVLALGWLVYQRTKCNELLAYVAGSFKVIPFLAAASMHAIYEGCSQVPMIVTHSRGELSYGENLAGEARRTGCHKLAYVDVSYRTGKTLRTVNGLVEKLNEGQELNLNWHGNPLVFVNKWPRRKRDVDEPLDVLLDR